MQKNYRKVLFRGNKRLQDKELAEIQNPISFPRKNFGLVKGGFISLSPTLIYIEPALIQLAHITYEMDQQVIDKKNNASFYLHINTSLSPSDPNPLMGGPFIGALGSDRESTKLYVSEEISSIKLFSIDNKGHLKIEPFFRKQYKSQVNRVIEGFELSNSLLYPGKAYVDGQLIEINNVTPLDIDLDSIIYLSTNGIEQRDLPSISFTSIGNLYSTHGLKIVSIPASLDVSGLPLYEIKNMNIERLFHLYESLSLTELEEAVHKQRRVIADLNKENYSSRISLSLFPGIHLDKNHPSFFSSIEGDYAKPFISKLSATPLGNSILTTSYTQSRFIEKRPTDNIVHLIPSQPVAYISTKPNYVPSLSGSLPDSLSIDIEAQYLKPQSNYYLGINSIPNYSSPITSSIRGDISLSISLPKEKLSIPLSLSLWDENGEEASIILNDRPIDPLPFPSSNYYLGQVIHLYEPINLHSIEIDVDIDNTSLPNGKLLSLVLTDRNYKPIAVSSNTLLDTTFNFDKLPYLKAETYYFFLYTDIDRLFLKLAVDEDTSYILYRYPNSIDKQIGKSLSYRINQAVISLVDKDPIELGADYILDTTLHIEDNNLHLSTPYIGYIDAANSFKLSTFIKLPSSWVSPLYTIRPYKEIELVIESDTDDIEPYISPDHRAWDKPTIISKSSRESYYILTYNLSYSSIHYEVEGTSIARDKLSVLIDMVNKNSCLRFITVIIKA